jgi:hypothetical protein
MYIDRQQLGRNVQAFLQGPDGGALLAQSRPSVAEGLVVTAIALSVGCILLPTIIWTINGLKMIGYALSLKAFSEGDKRDAFNDPSRLVPLLAHGIIIGPHGHALLLATFDPNAEQDVGRLAGIAGQLANLYSNGPTRPQDEAMHQLLRDDVFQEHRRRRVPAPYADGVELYLFDAFIDKAKIGWTSGGIPLVACVATPGEEGVIAQVPWQVVAPALR